MYQEIVKIPKVLLHTHLEGSVPVKTLNTIARRNGVKIPEGLPNLLLREMQNSKDFNKFREYYNLICSSFRTAEDFSDSILAYSEELSKHNVKYVELNFSIWKHLSRGIALDTIADGLLKGIEESNKTYDIYVKVICDLVRNKGEKIDYIFDWYSELPRTHFPTIGVSGGPGAIDRKKYIPIIEKAKNLGYFIVAHAGEFEGPESIKFVIDKFKVDRIGHGLRIIEDINLIKSTKYMNIHFELCPTSTKTRNVGTPGYTAIKNMISEGLSVSINTDDELFFKTNISQEINLLVESDIITFQEIPRYQINAINHASIVNEFERATILNQLSV